MRPRLLFLSLGALVLVGLGMLVGVAAKVRGLAPATIATVACPAEATWCVDRFGARGDGRTDDTASIQRALDAALPGAIVLLRPGRYRLSCPAGQDACLRLRHGGVTIQGTGATLISTSVSGATLRIEAEGAHTPTSLLSRVRISGLAFCPAVDRAADAVEILAPHVRGLEGDHLRFTGAGAAPGASVVGGDAGEGGRVGTCVAIGNAEATCGGCRFEDIDAGGYRCMFALTNAIDCAVVSAYGATGGATGPHVCVRGACEALQFRACDWIGGTGPVLLVAAGPGPYGGIPRTCRWTDCYFDSCDTGVRIEAGEALVFSGCWATGNRRGIAFCIPAGAQARGISIIGGEYVYSGGPAIALLAGSDHLIQGALLAGACTATPSMGLIHIGAGVARVLIQGNRGGNALLAERLGAGAASVSVLIDAGASGITCGPNSWDGLPLGNRAGAGVRCIGDG